MDEQQLLGWFSSNLALLQSKNNSDCSQEVFLFWRKNSIIVN